MEWFTGLAFLPALVCGLMMGGMALGGVLGLRRSQHSGSVRDAPDGVDEGAVESRR